ncbi:hypothetical protein DBR06_SOUSAS3410138, partial [Sousa chinensis]
IKGYKGRGAQSLGQQPRAAIKMKLCVLLQPEVQQELAQRQNRKRL